MTRRRQSRARNGKLPQKRLTNARPKRRRQGERLPPAQGALHNQNEANDGPGRGAGSSRFSSYAEGLTPSATSNQCAHCVRGLEKDAAVGAVDCCSFVLPTSTRILIQNFFVLLFNLGRKIQFVQSSNVTLLLAATESRTSAIEEAPTEPGQRTRRCGGKKQRVMSPRMTLPQPTSPTTPKSTYWGGQNRL